MLLQACLQGAQMNSTHCLAQPPQIDPNPKAGDATVLSPNQLIATAAPVGTSPTQIIIRVNAQAGTYILRIVNGLPDDAEQPVLYRTTGTISVNGTVLTITESNNLYEIPVALTAGENLFTVSINKSSSQAGFGFITAIVDGLH
jgi:hypothetical protein